MSAEDQERADQRIPELLATPAAVRFVSCEPLLGPVDLMRISTGAMTETDALLGWLTTYHDYKPAPGQPPMGSGNCEARSNPEHRISWVIVGGESGPGARPCDVEWIRSIVRQCQAAGVAVFVKQLGAKPREHFLDRGEWPVDLEWCGSRNVPPVSSPEREPDWWAPVLSDRKGGDMSEWPEDLRVREMPR